MVVGHHLNRHAIAPLVFLRINPRTALKRSAPFRSSTTRAIASNCLIIDPLTRPIVVM